MPKKSPKTTPASKIASLENKLKRSLADYANLEKRIQKQRQLYAIMAATGILSQMIEILDDLHLTQKHLKNPALKMVIDKFQKTLSGQGLKEIEAKGKIFDPKLMDCVDVAQGKQDHIVSVQKKGYTFNNQVLRPARVVVGRQKIKN